MTTHNNSISVIWIDRITIFCLGILVFILPVQHTATIRVFAFYTPLMLLLVRYRLEKNFTWHKTSFELPFIFFFLAALISLITASNFQRSSHEIWKNLIVPIMFFYTFYYAIKKESDVLFFVAMLFLGNLASGVYSFYESMTHGNALFSPTYRTMGLKGASEANGLYQSMVFPFLFWGLFYFRKYWQRLGIIILLAVNIITLNLTLSRSALLSIGVQISIIILLLFYQKKWLCGILMIISLILAVSLVVHKKMLREVHTYDLSKLKLHLSLTPEEIAKTVTTSTGERLAIWKTAIDLILQKPMHAHGYGRFNFGEMIKSNNNNLLYPHIHNTFISTAYELGIQGLVIFLWMIGTFLISIWRNWRKNTNNLSNFISAAALTMMTGYWAANCFQNFDADDIKLLFMVMLGIAMAVSHKLPKENPLKIRDL